MTDRWFSFIVWLAVVAFPIAISILIDARTRRSARSRKMSDTWMFEHRGRHVA